MRGSGVALVLVAVLALLTTTANALPPPLPASFWGIFNMNGTRVSLTSDLTAHVDGILCGRANLFLYQGTTYYMVSVKGDNPDTPEKDCGVRDDVVQFRLNGAPLATTGVWQAGGNSRLDLLETSPHRLTASNRAYLLVVISRYAPVLSSGR